MLCLRDFVLLVFAALNFDITIVSDLFWLAGNERSREGIPHCGCDAEEIRQGEFRHLARVPRPRSSDVQGANVCSHI
jgi:hypothetical protein